MYLDAKKAKFLKDHGLQLLERSEYTEGYASADDCAVSADREYWGLPDLHDSDWIVCARKGRIDVGCTARWSWLETGRICVPNAKRVRNNHSFFDSVTRILNDIEKLKRQRAEIKKRQRLKEITEAGNEYAVD